MVAEKINASHPHIKIQHIYKKTLGDADLNTPLDKMPDIGVFTNDIRHDLINKKADIAVHSWKDLPVDLEQGTEIVGTIERGDMRDMLFLKSLVSIKEVSQFLAPHQGGKRIYPYFYHWLYLSKRRYNLKA